MTRSPAKKQLLVSLAVNTGAPTTTTTTSTASSLNRHNNHHMMGKSVEDIYDKVTDHQVVLTIHQTFSLEQIFNLFLIDQFKENGQFNERRTNG